MTLRVELDELCEKHYNQEIELLSRYFQQELFDKFPDLKAFRWRHRWRETDYDSGMTEIDEGSVCLTTNKSAKDIKPVIRDAVLGLLEDAEAPITLIFGCDVSMTATRDGKIDLQCHYTDG